jgi:hypothetical protein
VRNPSTSLPPSHELRRGKQDDKKGGGEGRPSRERGAGEEGGQRSEVRNQRSTNR